MEKRASVVKPIPEGYHNITPILSVKNAGNFIDFLKQAFDAKERYRVTGPEGEIMHAEVVIGDSFVMLGEATEERGPMTSALYVYVEDADATFNKAIKAGGVSVMSLENKFYGDRSGCVKDPAGNIWWIATHVEDVSPEEMHEREEKYVMQKH